MPTLTIDQQPVQVPDGATILDAARKLAIDIPALCHRDGCTPNTSCLCCVVSVNGSSRLVPSCATVAIEGMKVASQTPEVLVSRKTALELLLADHAGDCSAPCTNVCPAHMDIPKMIGLIQANKFHDALVVVKQHIALPAILGRICPDLCETGCRRKSVDSPVSICKLKRFVADVDLESGKPWLPEKMPETGKKIAIIGSGPAGMAAAWHLQALGHSCDIFDQNPMPGGALRYALEPGKLPHEIIDAEFALIRKLGAKFFPRLKLGVDLNIRELADKFDAVLLAAGELEPAKARDMGLEIAGKGLKVDHDTMRTTLDKVFAAGGCILPTRHAIRAVADGRSAALSIDRFVRGLLNNTPARFTVRLGTISKEELSTFMHDASEIARTTSTDGFSPSEARGESSRCLHCECSKVETCLLKQYAEKYDAKTITFKTERRLFQRNESSGIVHEPGKCIACGLCVQIAGNAKEKLGLTFIGRGFDVRVGVPFSGELNEALQKTADQCVASCPTGALYKKKT